MAPRRMIVCINCGEHKEHAAHGLCFMCRRRAEREQEQPFDRHANGMPRQHQQLLDGFHDVMKGCTKMKVSRPDRLKFRRLLDPYLEPVAEYLSGEQVGRATREHYGDGHSERTSSHSVDESGHSDDNSGEPPELSVTDSPEPESEASDADA
jgi:hypothetical protein